MRTPRFPSTFNMLSKTPRATESGRLWISILHLSGTTARTADDDSTDSLSSMTRIAISLLWSTPVNASLCGPGIPDMNELYYRGESELNERFIELAVLFQLSLSRQLGSSIEFVVEVQEIATRQYRAIMLIGLLLPNYLARMPATVRAGTGLNQWRKNITPRQQTDEEMRTVWELVSDDVSETLDRPGAIDHTPIPEQEVV